MLKVTRIMYQIFLIVIFNLKNKKVIFYCNFHANTHIHTLKLYLPSSVMQ